MSRHHRLLQGQNLIRKPSPKEAVVMMTVANRYCDEQNLLMERAAEVFTLLTGFMMQKMEDLNAKLDGNTPFSMKLKNRTNHVVKACEEFLGVLEPYIDDDNKKQAYLEIAEIIYPSLENLFESLHVSEKDPSLKLLRRAKLRYHEPYKTAVAEQTAAFEDGYCKGYKDCVADVHRELKKLKDEGDGLAVIDIIDGEVHVKEVERTQPKPKQPNQPIS